mmetsp:Transcript_12923/g.54202  ORF Transcript_12923/g.54202 Transcript_12923/m.54202 type:complete len:229 (+) Transcript_12923:985-1671(+)
MRSAFARRVDSIASASRIISSSSNERSRSRRSSCACARAWSAAAIAAAGRAVAAAVPAAGAARGSGLPSAAVLRGHRRRREQRQPRALVGHPGGHVLVSSGVHQPLLQVQRVHHQQELRHLRPGGSEVFGRRVLRAVFVAARAQDQGREVRDGGVQQVPAHEADQLPGEKGRSHWLLRLVRGLPGGYGRCGDARGSGRLREEQQVRRAVHRHRDPRGVQKVHGCVGDA